MEDERIEQLMSELDRIKLELNHHKKKEEILNKELLNLNYKVNLYSEESNELERRKKNALKKLQLLKSSRSWKITSPLRKVMSLMKEKQDEKMSHISYEKRKVSVKDQELRSIKYTKNKLYSLGFKDRALRDLDDMYRNGQSIKIRYRAALELFIWYANKSNAVEVEKALGYLTFVMEHIGDETLKTQLIILEIDCLIKLGRYEEAIARMNTTDDTLDMVLVAANISNEQSSILSKVNKVLKLNNVSEISFMDNNNKSLFDRLVVSRVESIFNKQINPAKVSIIMPVYNSQNYVETSIRSLMSQSWKNIEIIIVDDHSTDSTASIIKTLMATDDRIKLLQLQKNQGTYIARNYGLKSATGDYITCQDADDWAHPQKIEKQVLSLIENDLLIGNISQTVRTTPDFKFVRKGLNGKYIYNNLSSLMFRRVDVLEKVGYWDCVRFGGDGEYLRRIKKVFGEHSVEVYESVLSFARVLPNSLTENGPFGYFGYFFGARKEYVDSFKYFHREHALELKYDFPQDKRPFPIPNSMKPDRAEGTRHFDVIIASDFRLVGGTTSSNLEEIKAQMNAGLRTGLIQMSRYKGTGDGEINSKIREIIDGEQVQMLVYGEQVTCDTLIIRHPPVLQEKQKYIPDVKAERINVIINQTPRTDYGETGEIAYDIVQCQLHLDHYFNHQPITWFPISPLIRQTLINHHSNELENINLSDTDWVNIINIEEWKRDRKRRPDLKKIVIGRHSRDQYVKWPTNPEELLTIYPDVEPFEVNILGGAATPEKILGSLPLNWKVMDFGEMEPVDFLSSLDVFVYYTHPECVEAFGRVIIEAMAAGVPVILPPSYYDLFKDAAIYAEKGEVRDKIIELMNNSDLYNMQIKKAYEFLSSSFGYSHHLNRLKNL